VLGFKLDDARIAVSVLPAAVAYLFFERNHVGSEISYYKAVHQELIRQEFPAIYKNRLAGALMMPTVGHETMSLFPYVPVTLSHLVLILLGNVIVALLPLAFLIYAYVELYSTFGGAITVWVSLAASAVFYLRTEETVLAERQWNRAAIPLDDADDDLDALPKPMRRRAEKRYARERERRRARASSGATTNGNGNGA
jgi:hypothetical protein